MLKPESLPIDKIYVPVKRKKALKRELVQEIAESILEIGQQAPIVVRRDVDRFVLVEGFHRLEACRALGEKTIMGLLVSAEIAHQKTLFPDSPESEAERDKMARLRKMRLEKEAADKLGCVLINSAAESRRTYVRLSPNNGAKADIVGLPRWVDAWPRPASMSGISSTGKAYDPASRN